MFLLFLNWSCLGPVSLRFAKNSSLLEPYSQIGQSRSYKLWECFRQLRQTKSCSPFRLLTEKPPSSHLLTWVDGLGGKCRKREGDETSLVPRSDHAPCARALFFAPALLTQRVHVMCITFLFLRHKISLQIYLRVEGGQEMLWISTYRTIY